MLAKIDISAMTSVVRGVERSVGDLTADRGSLRNILAGVQVDTAPAARFDPVIAWAETELPGLRRRLALAVSIEESKPGGFRGGVATIDESAISTLTPEQAGALAEQTAKKLADSRGNPGPDLVNTLAANQADPYFAAALARSMSPQELTDLVASMTTARRDFLRRADNGDELAVFEANHRRLLDALGNTIAVATRNRGDLALPRDYAAQWVRLVTTSPVPTAPGAASLLLSRGVYDTEFLTTLATGVYDVERGPDGRPGMWQSRATSDGMNPTGAVEAPDGRQVYDPMSGLMNALGNNPEAAQRWLRYDRMEYLIQQRRWPDDGDGLGNALEAGSTVFRDRTEAGRRSAEIAGQALHLMAQKSGEGANAGYLWTGLGKDAGWQIPTGMRDSVGRIVASYMADVYRTVGSSHADVELGKEWVFTGTDDGLPAGGPYGALMSDQELSSIMMALGADKDAFGHVVAAGLQMQTNVLDHALRSAAGEPGSTAIEDFLRGNSVNLVDQNGDRSAAVLGWMLRHGIEGSIADEELKKEQREAFVDLLSAGVGLVPVPGGKFAEFAVSQTTDGLLSQLKEAGGGESAVDRGNTRDDDVRESLERQSYNALIASGYLGRPRAGDAAPPGDIVHVGPDGRPDRLKTSEELAATPGATASYQNWYNNHAPKQWVDANMLPRYQTQFPANFGE
ncbi:MAG: transposase [Mycobacterium sp.]|nr:transposase [Mycobacterium sp.]